MELPSADVRASTALTAIREYPLPQLPDLTVIATPPFILKTVGPPGGKWAHRALCVCQQLHTWSPGKGLPSLDWHCRCLGMHAALSTSTSSCSQWLIESHLPCHWLGDSSTFPGIYDRCWAKAPLEIGRFGGILREWGSGAYFKRIRLWVDTVLETWHPLCFHLYGSNYTTAN